MISAKLGPAGRILIVDDQRNWRLALVKLLEGHEVSLAESVDEAKQALQKNTFDVVILDVRLIDLDALNVDGIGLLRTLKCERPDMGLIVLTAYPENIRREVLERYPPDHLLLKVPPGLRFDSDGFRAKVGELVERSQKRIS